MMDNMRKPLFCLLFSSKPHPKNRQCKPAAKNWKGKLKRRRGRRSVRVAFLFPLHLRLEKKVHEKLEQTATPSKSRPSPPPPSPSPPTTRITTTTVVWPCDRFAVTHAHVPTQAWGGEGEERATFCAAGGSEEGRKEPTVVKSEGLCTSTLLPPPDELGDSFFLFLSSFSSFFACWGRPWNFFRRLWSFGGAWPLLPSPSSLHPSLPPLLIRDGKEERNYIFLAWRASFSFFPPPFFPFPPPPWEPSVFLHTLYSCWKGKWHVFTALPDCA